MYSSAFNGEVWSGSLSYKGRLKDTMQTDAVNIGRTLSMYNNGEYESNTVCGKACPNNALPIFSFRLAADGLRVAASEMECIHIQ